MIGIQIGFGETLEVDIQRLDIIETHGKILKVDTTGVVTRYANRVGRFGDGCGSLE